MKKLIIISCLVLFSSCGAFKKITDKKSSIVQTTEKTKDSTSTVKTNGEIKDRIVVNVPKSDNQEVMKMFDVVLSSLNTSKSSGTNSYTSTYDEETRQLVIDFIVAQTQNKETNTKVEQSFEEKTDEYISKKVSRIPLWVWIALGVWFLPQILQRVNLIINPVSGFIKGFKNANKQ